MQESIIVHRLMIRIQPGIDDRDPAASAGIAQLIPGICCADHVFAGVGGHRVICLAAARDGRFIVALALDLAHAIQALDERDLLDLHVRGDRVRKQGQVPLHIQRVTKDGFDLRRERFLLRFQRVAVGRGALVFGNAHGRIAGINSRLAA